MRTLSCKCGDILRSCGAEADMILDFKPLLEGIILLYLVGILNIPLLSACACYAANSASKDQSPKSKAKCRLH